MGWPTEARFLHKDQGFLHTVMEEECQEWASCLLACLGWDLLMRWVECHQCLPWRECILNLVFHPLEVLLAYLVILLGFCHLQELLCLVHQEDLIFY